MEIKQTQKINQEIISDIICDSCGKSCKVDEFVIDNPQREDFGQMCYSFEYMKLEANWGYHSGKDLTNMKAHLCEKCVDEKLTFIKFKDSKIKFTTRLTM